MVGVPKQAAATILLLATAFAGCLDEDGAPNVGDGGNVPGLPELVFAPEAVVDNGHRGGEPSVLVDDENNYYVSAPSGMVTSVINPLLAPETALAMGPQNRWSFIWKSEDQGATWRLLSETPAPLPPTRADATLGGADTDIAIDDCGTVYFTDLWLGNIAVSHSDDGGDTWLGTPITGILPVLDRNWIAADTREGHCGTVYLFYQTFYGQLWALQSTDKGLTWPQQVLIMDCNGTPLPQHEGCYTIDGPLVFDDATGNLYAIAGLADGKGVWVFRSTDDGNTWDKTAIEADGDVNNIFPVVATDWAGNVYAVASFKDGGSFNVYMATSQDAGKTFTEFRSVSGPETNGTEVFPWVAAGTEGRVAVAWYGTNETVASTDDVTGDWFVYVAAAEDAFDANATWTIELASEKPMHHGEICTLGLTCTLPEPVGTRGNRNLADFFEIAIDHTGRVVAAWSSDYDSADQLVSFPRFGRQIEGMHFIAIDATPAPVGGGPGPEA